MQREADAAVRAAQAMLASSEDSRVADVLTSGAATSAAPMDLLRPSGRIGGHRAMPYGASWSVAGDGGSPAPEWASPGVQRSFRHVIRCFLDGLSAGAISPRRVTMDLRVEVRRNGSVERASLSATQPANPSLEACVLASVRTWRFEQDGGIPRGGPTAAVVSIGLTPPNDPYSVASVASITTSGARSAETLRPAVARAMLSLYACHDRALREDPSARGAATIRFTVRDDGSLERSPVVEGVTSTTLSTCLARWARDLRVGDVASGPTDVTLALDLAVTSVRSPP